jgi:hypothetical protein
MEVGPSLTIECDKSSDLIRVLKIWVAEFTSYYIIRVFVKGWFFCVCVRSAGCWPCLPKKARILCYLPTYLPTYQCFLKQFFVCSQKWQLSIKEDVLKKK